MGGTYRAMILLPVMNIDQAAYGAEAEIFGIGDA